MMFFFFFTNWKAPLLESKICVYKKYLGLMLYSVRSLLKLSDLSDDVGNLKKRLDLHWQSKWKYTCRDYFSVVFLCVCLPSSFWRSLQDRPQLNWVSPPQWRPGQSDTFPGTAHTEGCSWRKRVSTHTVSRPLEATRVHRTCSATSYFFSVSLRFFDLPSRDTVFCSLSMRVLAWTRSR